MKVIRPGREQKGWAAQFTCTGVGNGMGGCKALLLVEAEDIYLTMSNHYDGSTDYFFSFRCTACGVVTDAPNEKIPSMIRNMLMNNAR